MDHFFITFTIAFKTALFCAFISHCWKSGIIHTINDRLLKYADDKFLYYSGDFIEEETPLILEPPKYENKYLEQYEKLENHELSQEKMESLINNFIMENTPVGNVVMFYDHTKSSFSYYSDSVVPYRYLEPVGRKYVVVYNCKSLFVDMKEEIDKSKEQQSNATNAPVKQMKTKDILKGFSKPSTTNKTHVNNNVKAHTNRYTSLGRYSNFKITKKVDKKAVDKNYSLSFSDFKQMMANKTSL